MMKRLFILSAFLVGAALLSPSVRAADHDNDGQHSQVTNRHDKRYYDRDGKDYHVFNSNEDRAYRVYLGDEHQNYRTFNRLNRNQQQQYFNWRHQHSDNTLFKVVIR